MNMNNLDNSVKNIHDMFSNQVLEVLNIDTDSKKFRSRLSTITAITIAIVMKRKNNIFFIFLNKEYKYAYKKC